MIGQECAALSAVIGSEPEHHGARWVTTGNYSSLGSIKQTGRYNEELHWRHLWDW